MHSVTPRFLTAALYQFVDLPDFAALREPLQALCDAHGVRGAVSDALWAAHDRSRG